MSVTEPNSRCVIPRRAKSSRRHNTSFSKNDTKTLQPTTNVEAKVSNGRTAMSHELWIDNSFVSSADGKKNTSRCQSQNTNYKQLQNSGVKKQHSSAVTKETPSLCVNRSTPKAVIHCFLSVIFLYCIWSLLSVINNISFFCLKLLYSFPTEAVT